MDFWVLYYAGIGYGWSIALSLCLPDVFILKNDACTDRRSVYETVFHELAHSSHFHQVGIGYWRNYVNHIIVNTGYGNGNEPLAGYCGVGEMWGNFFGYNLGRHKFGSISLYYDALEGWYHPGFLMDLHDLAGFTEAQIFSCLTSGIHSIPALRDELISKFPLKTNQINSLYEYYF